MSNARFFITVAGVCGSIYGIKKATEWKIGNATQTGVINNVGKEGLFIKTYEMHLQRSSFPNGNPDNDMSMSLQRNWELIDKAQKYCEEGTFVKVKYESFCLFNPFEASSNRIVKDIEPVENHKILK